MKLYLENGQQFEAVHMFNQRAIINMEGAFVMVDHVTGNHWTLSSEPARPGPELEALNALVKPGTTVKVTSPDGDTETFKDE